MNHQRIPNLRTKRVLWSTLWLLRLVLVISVIAYGALEIMKFNSNKEVIHLAMFSMFFLLGNFQVGVGRHNAVVSKEEAESIFFLTLFSISAALLELVDLALDQILKELNQQVNISYIFGICLAETILGFCAVLLVYYSLERFLVHLRSISFKLKDTSL